MIENDLTVRQSASLSVCMSMQNSLVCSVAMGYSCLCVRETKEEGVRTPYVPCQPCHIILPTLLTECVWCWRRFRNIDTVGLFTCCERVYSKANTRCRAVIHVHIYHLCACFPPAYKHTRTGARRYTHAHTQNKKTHHGSGEQGVPEKENREQGGLF